MIASVDVCPRKKVTIFFRLQSGNIFSNRDIWVHSEPTLVYQESVFGEKLISLSEAELL